MLRHTSIMCKFKRNSIHTIRIRHNSKSPHNAKAWDKNMEPPTSAAPTKYDSKEVKVNLTATEGRALEATAKKAQESSLLNNTTE